MFKKKIVNVERESDLLRISIAAKDEVIAAWKDRGDRYAANNRLLLDELLKVYQMLTQMLEQRPEGSEFKKLLEKALESRSCK